MKTQVLSAFSLSLLLVAMVSPALAQEDAAIANLEAISIKEDEDEAATEVITREKLDEENASDLEDTFRHSPEVNVGGGGQDVGQKIYVRGIEDTNLNVTVDGARQSGYVFHHRGRVTVDMELIKQVDVIAGAGTALSGAGALGGAIRFDTKDVEDLLRPGTTYGAFLKGRYRTVDDEKGVALGLFAKPTDRTGILLYGNLAESIDYRTGSGARQVYTAGKPKSYLGKLSFQPSENQKLTLSTIARIDNATRLLRAHFGSFPNNSPRDEKFKNESYTLRYEVTPSNLLNLRAEIYDTKTDFSQTLAGAESVGTSQTTGADLRNLFKLGLLNVTAGADFAREKGEAVRTTARNSESVDIFGLYAQADYQLSAYWSASAGARFDDYKLKDISSQKVKASGVSPNLGVRYALSKEQGLFATHTRAFRGPTPIEAFVLAGATSAASNPNIKGTRSETSEIGWEQRKEILRARVSGFYTKFNHPLDNVSLGGVATRQNVPDIKSQGFVVSAGSLLNNWELGASYTHVRLSFGDEPIGYSGATSFSRGAPTGDRANARIGYRFTPLNLIASFSSLMIMKLDRLPTGQAAQPGYEVYDANLAWVPNDQIQVNFSVQNVFDKHYVAQGTPFLDAFRSVYEPGRDFRLSASYLF